MIRVALYILLVGVIAFAAAWLADRPGDLVLQWQGWHIETSVMVAAVGVLAIVVVSMILWTVIRVILHGPSAMSGYFKGRRQTRGYKALSRGMVAAGAGDARLARHASKEARKLLSNEPLTLLLDAQAAQLGGDRKAAIAAFESMTERPDTELLGLRGLLIEAQRAGDEETARACIERAAARAPGLGWAANALLETQTRKGDWEAALATIERNAEHRLIDKKAAKRARAVLLTAQALEREEADPERAMALALEAHKLAPELVPAAAVAARQSAATGNARQATRVIEKTWRLSPHPDLAGIYAHARAGDSARDRLKRARALADKMPNNVEGRIGVAVAAIEARDWAEARAALEPLTRTQPSQRICLLMADIAEGETGDAGKVREWLSRAVRAPRDPAWTADGYVSETWAPVSPISGHLDAFEWKVPVEALGPPVEDEEPEPDAAPAPMIEARPAPAVSPVPAAEPAAEKPAATAPMPVEPEPEESAPPAPATPASASASGGTEAGQEESREDKAGEPAQAAAGATGEVEKADVETPLSAETSEATEEEALESAEEAIAEFVDEKASGAVAPTVAPIVEGVGDEGVEEASDETPEKDRPFLMGRAPDDPGPLPPDDGEGRPKKRFGLF